MPLLAIQYIFNTYRNTESPYRNISRYGFARRYSPLLSAHSFASNWHLLFLNQRKRENGRRNVFMTKSPWKNVPDVGIELGAACMPSELASDRATTPGLSKMVYTAINSDCFAVVLLGALQWLVLCTPTSAFWNWFLRWEYEFSGCHSVFIFMGSLAGGVE